MALEEQTISVRFSGGVETKQDAKGVAYTKLLALENGVFTKGISIKKRNGYDVLGTVGTDGAALPSTPRALATRGDELLRFSDSKAHGYVEALGKWDEIDDVLSVGLAHRAVAKTTAEQTDADYDEVDGIGVYAWTDSRGGVYFSVVDSATDKIIVRPTQLKALGSRPRVLAVGHNVHVYCADATNGYIWLLVVPSVSPLDVVTPSLILLIEGVNTSRAAFDVAAFREDLTSEGNARDVPRVALTWHRSDGDIGLCYVTTGGVVGSPLNSMESGVTIAAGSADLGPIIAVDPYVEATATDQFAPIVVLWREGVTELGAVLNYSEHYRTLVAADTGSMYLTGTPVALAATFQAHAEDYVTSPPSPNGRRRLHIFHAAAAGPVYRAGLRTTDGTFATSEVASVLLYYGVGLASGGFRDTEALSGTATFADTGDGEHVYVNVYHSTTLYTTYLTMREDGVIVASYLSGIAGGAPATAEHLPAVKCATEDRTARWAAIYRNAIDTDDDDVTVYSEKGIRLVNYDFDDPQQHQTAQLGDTLYMTGGGFVQAYDGDSFVEMFHWAIDDVAAPTQANSTGTIAAGTYIYRFSLEYILANGEVLRGPVSAGTTVIVTAGNDTVTFAIPKYRVTQMTSPRGEVRIGVWRTEVNSGDAFYRISSLDPTATGNNGYVANAPGTGSATIAFIDGMPDATLITKEPLYTNGGILNNDPFEAGQLIVAGKNRLWTNDASDPLLLHYSQELAAGYAVEFSPLLTVRLDPMGGPITALAIMDDTVVVFKETAIFAFAGPGPLANPDAGGGFSVPQIVPSGVGCIDRRSVAVTPAGVLFQSNKGIWLIDRSRQVTYVGAPVEVYSSQTITSAEVLEDRHEVRLLTSSGVTLVWDYLFDQWSTFTNHEGLDAAIVDGVYHYLRADGTVWKETDGEYADAERPIVFALETAWVKLRDVLQGFQMIWTLEVLGEWKSAHALVVHIQYDYEPGWYDAPWEVASSEFFDAQDYGDGNYGDGNYGGDFGTHGYQIKLHVAEECEAFRVRFEFVEATGVFGACAELSELLVHGAVTGPRKTLGDTRSY